MIKRGHYEGERPSLERDGLKYVFDYDVILANTGDEIKKQGNGYKVVSRHVNPKGDFTTVITAPNAILGPQGAKHDDMDESKVDIIGLYILAA